MACCGVKFQLLTMLLVESWSWR